MGNWKDSKDFVLEAARTTLDRLLEGAGLGHDSIDRFLVTESVGPLRDAVVEHLGIPASKTTSVLADHGNTMSAGIPLLWCAAESASPLAAGSTTAILSFGEGISGGGILYRH